MRRTLAILALLCLSGCRTIVYTAADGRKLEYYSFGNDTAIGKLEVETPQGHVGLENLDSKAKGLDTLDKLIEKIPSRP